MKRKDFIKLTSLGILATPFLSYTKSIEREWYDVAIIGAGLSGLTAARMLHEGGKKIIVLEAQDRVGGRTWSQPIGQNSFIDIGGQWIGKGHERMYQLAAEAGIKTFPTYTTGKSIFRQEGENKIIKGSTPPLGLWSLLASQKMVNRFDYAASKMSLDAPWSYPDAAVMDQLSLGEWIDQTTVNQKARMLMKLAAEGELCMPAENISLLQALSAAKATGSLKQAEKVEGGALQDRMHGGAQGISKFLYEKVKGSVKLNCPVTFVNHSQEYVQVGNNDFSIRAKQLIITAPFSVVKNISFTPELPIEKQLLINSMTMGKVIKCHMVYSNPFWREEELNGSSTTLDENVELTVDNSVPGSEQGILTSLIHANRAEALLKFSAEDRKKIVLDSYVNLFGESARTPLDYHEYSFTENPWIGGAYSGHYANGIFSKYGAHIGKPTGRIHWAGTETSHLFKGFMEGAVLSGERVAREMI